MASTTSCPKYPTGALLCSLRTSDVWCIALRRCYFAEICYGCTIGRHACSAAVKLHLTPIWSSGTRTTARCMPGLRVLVSSDTFLNSVSHPTPVLYAPFIHHFIHASVCPPLPSQRSKSHTSTFRPFSFHPGPQFPFTRP